MLTAIMAAVACVLACFALVTVDDPAAGRRPGRTTFTAAAVVAISVFFFCCKLAGMGTSADSGPTVPAWLALVVGGLSGALLWFAGAMADRLVRDSKRRRTRWPDP